ncbi:hypothetical protein E3Q17_03620 [Wallemia mellicola]|uniref:Sterol regulatory element-binding protein cleavage-activating protein n=1 Tax=Wallemia mellicola TaxID=1708541 RepID=A0A4V4MKT9_9BASI|nr:hypothetical protein E3Q17_03620 [Wallemia mellicola]
MLGEFSINVRKITKHLNYLQGVQCARNQVSTLLACGLAITALFYPAFGVLLWSKSGRQSSFWNILEENTLTNSNDFKSLEFSSIWDLDDAFKVELANVAPVDMIVERIISPFDQTYDALLEEINALSISRCIRSSADKECLILSPNSEKYNQSSYTLTHFQSHPYAISTILFQPSEDHDQWWSNTLSSTGEWSVEKGLSARKTISVKLRDNLTESDWSSVPYIFGIAYALFIIYVSISVSRLNQVHSRFGLAITGIVQLCVSTVMSISLLELCGWRLRLLPWTVVPFVIVVVGVENMLTITRAIVSTSISLPVPERVGQGMAKVGPVIGMTVLSDLTLLGIAGYVIPGTIREFCIFASVVSVIDYFLQSTFFITVLSVDIQRLELSDLIHQGLQPLPPKDGSIDSKNAGDNSHPLVVATKAVWKARSTRNAIPSKPLIPLEAFRNRPTEPSNVSSSLDNTIELLWSQLSTSNDPLNLRIQSPTFVTKFYSQYQMMDDQKYSRFSPRFRALFWILKIVVLPIGSSLIALYCLLLFLLKDKELHELQRSKLDAEQRKQEINQEKPRLHVEGYAQIVDRKADIAMVETSSKLLVYLTLLNDVVVHTNEQSYYLISSPKDKVTTVACNDNYVATGFSSGEIILWDLQSGYPELKELKRQVDVGHNNSVRSLKFVKKSKDYKESVPLRSPYMLSNEETEEALVAVFTKNWGLYWPTSTFEEFSMIGTTEDFENVSVISLENDRILWKRQMKTCQYIISYDWPSRVVTLLTVVGEDVNSYDNFVDILKLNYQGSEKNLIVFQTPEGSVKLMEFGESTECEQIAELESLDKPILRTKLIQSAENDESVQQLFVVRNTQHKVYIDLVDIYFGDSCIDCGGTMSTTTTNVTSTLVPSTANNATPMLLRNRSRKSGSGSGNGNIDGYPLANHGFSRRVSAADKRDDQPVYEVEEKSSQCVHTKSLMTLDARFNDFVVLPYEDSIVGLRKTSDGEWEVWILKLSTHPELETSKVTLKDSERVSSSFNISVNPSTKTPRLLSLLNDETTRQKAQQNNSDAILPATRHSQMQL